VVAGDEDIGPPFVVLEELIMSIKVVADNWVRAEAVDDFIAVTKELIEQTHANDSGCLSYGLYRDTADPLHLTVLEEWADQPSLDDHCASPHFLRLLPALIAAAAKPGIITVYEEV